jgi:hypothetical protein
MILSADEIFSDGQAITASARSTNIIDLQAAGTPYGAAAALTVDVGKSTVIPISVVVTEDFATLTSLNIEVQCDGDPAFGSPKTVAKSGEIALADLQAGYQFKFPAEIMEGVDERYLALKYNVTGASATAGKVTAGIVAARQTN